MSSGAAASVLAAVTVLSQASAAQPGGDVAAAAAPAAAPAAVTAATAPRVAAAPSATLTAAVKAALAKATASSYSAVVDIAGVGRVVNLGGSTSEPPASTEKLFTALPLLTSRPQSRLVTSIGALSAPVAGVLHGDLVVRASGDPTLMGAHLEALAAQVRAAGVRRVTGRLVLNIGRLSLTRTRVGWKSTYVPGDVGPLSPFPVHEDVWRTSSSYVLHPTSGNLALLRSKLTAQHIAIAGADLVSTGGSTAHVFASRTSPTLGAIIAHTLQVSDNFAAEQLLSLEGFSAVQTVATASAATGTTTDGSGLSTQDRRSAAGEVGLLEHAQATTAGPAFVGSLPVACVSGTLIHEMCHTVAAGTVFAKTGTLAHTKALAGYTTDAAGRWVTFAFLTNGDTNTVTAMTAIEHAVLLLRHYAG